MASAFDCILPARLTYTSLIIAVEITFFPPCLRAHNVHRCLTCRPIRILIEAQDRCAYDETETAVAGKTPRSRRKVLTSFILAVPNSDLKSCLIFH
jgi:hypothetical protein